MSRRRSAISDSSLLVSRWSLNTLKGCSFTIQFISGHSAATKRTVSNSQSSKSSNSDVPKKNAASHAMWEKITAVFFAGSRPS